MNYSRLQLASVWIAFTALLIALTTFGTSITPLTKSTEARVAGIATKMYLSGDYVVPVLNNKPFLEKPPLYSWLTAFSYQLFGVSEWSARLPSMLASFGLCFLLVTHLKQRKQSVWVQFLTPLSLITMMSFWSYSRTSGQDVVLAFGVSFSLLYIYKYIETRHNRYLFPALIGVAIASLVKGVFAIAIIVAVMLSFNTLNNIFRCRVHWLKDTLKLSTLVLVGLIPLFIWLYSLYERAGWDAFYEVVWTNSVGRAQGNSGGHVEPWYYYFVRIPLLFQPWLALVILGAIYTYKKKVISSYELLLLCWLLVPILFLSLSSSKRLVYLLSLYPAASLLIGNYIHILVSEIQERRSHIPKWTNCALHFQLIISVCLLLYSTHKAYFVWHISPTWIIYMTAISALMLVVLVMNLKGKSLLSIAINILVVSGLYLFYGLQILPRESLSESYQKAFESLPSDAIIALYKPEERLRGAAVFYLGRSVTDLESTEELNQYIKDEFANYAIITENAEVLSDHGDIKTFSLKNDTVFLLSNRIDTTGQSN